jgi:hypothetical protein
MYLPVRVSLKDIKDGGKERSVKYMHSYFDKQIVVDMTENDYMYARDKKDILSALKHEFNFIDYEILGFESAEELFDTLQEWGFTDILFRDLKVYIDSIKKILVEHYVNGLNVAFRMGEEGKDNMMFSTEALIEAQACIEFMHTPYYPENKNVSWNEFSIREKVLQKTFLTKKNMVDIKLQSMNIPKLT